MAQVRRPVPFRTRKLRPGTAMVLHSTGCGRVARRRITRTGSPDTLKVPGLPAYRDTCAWGVYLASLGLSVLGLPPPWSASRKGNCIDNAATEQVFGYLKDEFYTGREFASYEEFRTGLDAYMVHWNTKRRQKQLEGHTPEEFRNMSLIA